MAENVEKSLEEFSKYMVLLKEVGLFTSSEISQLMKKLRLYESQLAGGTQLLGNYQKVIELEIGLVKEIKRRKREKNVSTALTGEYYFIRKVMRHYQKGLKYFPDNYEFIMQYFNFIKLFPEHQNVARLLVKDLLATFGGKKPEVYRKAASFYFTSDMQEEARKILLLGQSKFPEDIDIYLDLIEFEFRCKTKTDIGQRLKKYIDFIAENKLPRKFMEETILVIDHQLNVKPDLRPIAEYALEKLLSTYKDDVESYVFAANWEADQSQSKTDDQQYSVMAVTEGIKRLKQGVLALPAHKKPEILKRYIDFTKKVAEGSKNNPKLKGFLINALQEAEQAKVELSEEHFIEWVACHKTDPEIVLAKLEQAVNVYPTSDLVRVMYLKYLILTENWTKASVEFNKALDALGSNTLRVWDIYLAELTIKNRPEEVKALFERGVNDPHPNVSAVMKAKYCVWTYVNFGLKQARDLYFKLATTPPYSNELHQEMYRIERNSDKEADSGDSMNRVLFLWQEQFGTVEKDVYLHRVEILREQGAPDCNTRVSEVYRQAVTNLKDPEAVAAFKTSFESIYEKLWKPPMPNDL